MNLLITHSNGTVSRQIIRTALSEGHYVKYLVPNFQKNTFLRLWTEIDPPMGYPGGVY